jgi:hypothetical protein
MYRTRLSRFEVLTDKRMKAGSPLLLYERVPALGAEDHVVMQAEIVRHC